jgi:hypothetical protein
MTRGHSLKAGFDGGNRRSRIEQLHDVLFFEEERQGD